MIPRSGGSQCCRVMKCSAIWMVTLLGILIIIGEIDASTQDKWGENIRPKLEVNYLDAPLDQNDEGKDNFKIVHTKLFRIWV